MQTTRKPVQFVLLGAAAMLALACPLTVEAQDSMKPDTTLQPAPLTDGSTDSTLAGGQTAETDPGDEARYRGLIKEALAEYAANNFREAHALFRQAHALEPSARTLRGMGKASFNLKRYVEAIRDLQAALEDERRSLDSRMRQEVTGLLERAQRFVGRFPVDITPKTARVTVNGRPAILHDNVLLLDQGINQVTVSAFGHTTVVRQLQVVGGDEGRLRVTLKSLLHEGDLPEMDAEAPPPVDTSQFALIPRPDNAPRDVPAAASSSDCCGWAPWAMLAGAVAASGVAIVLKSVAHGRSNDIKRDCPPGQCSHAHLVNEIDDANIEGLNAGKNAAIGVGSGLLVGAVVLFILDGATPQDRAGTAAGLRAGATADNVHVVLDGRF